MDSINSTALESKIKRQRGNKCKDEIVNSQRNAF